MSVQEESSLDILSNTKVTFVGAGNMAQALAQGLIGAGIDASQLRATDLGPEQLKPLSDVGVATYTDNAVATAGADVIVLAVKPQVLVQVLSSLGELKPTQLVISIAAGIDIDTIAHVLGDAQPLVRCMPNTPALVSSGMSGLFANNRVSEVMQRQAQALLSAVGEVLWVSQEEQLDAVTAISGSGPAYFFYLMEAMVDAGVELGLSKEQAEQLTLQTALGAAKLAKRESPTTDASTLRRNVTSPGGTTERALNLLNDADVRDAIVRALHGAATRSAELSEEFGTS